MILIYSIFNLTLFIKIKYYLNYNQNTHQNWWYRNPNILGTTVWNFEPKTQAYNYFHLDTNQNVGAIEGTWAASGGLGLVIIRLNII